MFPKVNIHTILNVLLLVIISLGVFINRILLVRNLYSMNFHNINCDKLFFQLFSKEEFVFSIVHNFFSLKQPFNCDVYVDLFCYTFFQNRQSNRHKICKLSQTPHSFLDFFNHIFVFPLIFKLIIILLQ